MPDEKSKPLVGKVDAEKAIVVKHADTINMGLPTAAAQPPLPTATPPRNLPERNRRFVGRESELDEIHRRLSQSTPIGVTQQTGTHAQGGVGKTSIAHEYAWLHLHDYPGGVLVVSCDTDQLLPRIAELAQPLGLREGNTPEETTERVKAQLENGPAALLILDNVRDAGQWGNREWSACLPAGNCRRLITTRAAHLPGVEMFRIERLPRDKGVELLEKYRPDASTQENESIAGDIVDWFDGLAVGVTVVGVYMQLHPELGWSKYAESLESRGLGAVRDTERGTGPLPDYDSRVDSVFDDAVKALPPEQRSGLEYAALLPADTVVRAWLIWLLEHDSKIKLPTPPGYESHPAEGVVSELVALDLLHPSREGEDILAIHRVLGLRLQERLAKAPAKRERLLDSVVAMANERGEASRDAITKPDLRPELTPLVALAGELESAGRFDAAVRLANWIHTPLRELARYSQDRGLLAPMAKRCQSEQDSVAPAGHAMLLSNLAVTVRDLGDLPEALRLMEQAIEIEQKHFEADHPGLAVRYSNLGGIMRDLGDLPEARRLMEKAIEIDQKHFEADHPTLAIRYSNLALIVRDLGDLAEARRLMEQAIEIKQKHFEADHPTLAVSFSNLAMIVGDLGDLPKARRLMEQAIEIGGKHFDDDHPALVIYRNNLALILAAEATEACDGSSVAQTEPRP